ncbi:hypothetical protein D9M72_54180 [compost metagenome]
MQRLARLLRAAGENAFVAEQVLGDGPAHVEFADQVARRHAHVLEEDFAELLFVDDIGNGPDGHARRLQVDQQEADAGLRLDGLVGAHQGEDVGGVVRQRGPDLLAVDDVAVAFETGLGSQRGQVRTGVGFRVALAPDVLAREDARQVARLLFRRAVLDQHRAEVDDPLVGQSGGAPALHLFEEDQQLGRRQRHAAVLARPGRRQPAFAGQGLVPVADFAQPQPARHVAQVLRVMGAQEAAHHQAEAFVAHGVVVVARGGLAVGQGGLAARVAQGQVAGLQVARAAQPGRRMQGPLQIQAHVVLVGVADGPVQLHGFAAQADDALGDPGLGQRGHARQGGGIVAHLAIAVGQQRAADHHADVGVHHAVLQGLVRADRAAELHAGLEVVQREAEHAPRDAEKLAALEQPRELQGLLADRIHLVAFRDHAGGGQVRVQVQGAQHAAVHPGFRFHGDARVVGPHPDQGGRFAQAGVHQPAGGAGRRHPALGADQVHAVAGAIDRGGDRGGNEFPGIFLPGQARHGRAGDGVAQQFRRQRMAGEGRQHQRGHGAAQIGLRQGRFAHGGGDRAQHVDLQPQPALGFGHRHRSPAGFGQGAPGAGLPAGGGAAQRAQSRQGRNLGQYAACRLHEFGVPGQGAEERKRIECRHHGPSAWRRGLEWECQILGSGRRAIHKAALRAAITKAV